MKNKDSFITILGWMVDDLKLSGTDLIIYAIIYSFSQDCDSVFKGSLAYLAEWTGTSKRTVINALNRLVKDGFIRKNYVMRNNIRYAEYDYNPYKLFTLRKERA